MARSGPKSAMTVTTKATGRWSFYCFCCQTAPGDERKRERRRLKRRERQSWKREVTASQPSQEAS